MLTDQLKQILNEMDDDALLEYVLDNFSAEIEEYADETGAFNAEAEREAYD